MIKTLRLHNFKAFQDTGCIDLKPITVLAGPNSGGKSSILQSLLLLKQTLETETPDIDLNLDGRFLQFSGFNELTFDKPPLRRCQVDYEIRLETSIPTQVIPDYYPDLAIPQDAEWVPLRSDVKLSFRYREEVEGKSRVLLDSFDMLSWVQSLPGPRLTIAFQGKSYQVRLRGKGVDLPKPVRGRSIKSAGGRHFLPELLFLESDPEKGEEHLPAILLNQIFLHPLRDLELEIDSRLKYLGPLREEPRRAYLHSGSPFPEIGQKGEYAAQILWLEKDNQVQYLPALDQEPGEFTLMDAVSDAFQRLGISQPIDVRSEKSIIYQILFGIKDLKGKKQVTIADVGFGVSQLLPIVVMGVRSPESSLLLFEQPEIHLHPRLQANLADFFLTLALSGKRLLVETHSDHFINRLRRRIAEDPTDELKEKVSILLVRPPHNGQGATIEPLRVDRYGIIENWPPEFLPESADEAEAILLAGLGKRRGQ
jgi:predicted ATPase